MTDLIDRQAVREQACKGCTRHGDNIGECCDPDPCERLNIAFMMAPTIVLSDYCPNCGSKMDLEG